MGDLLQTEVGTPDSPEALPAPPLRGAIEFDKVSFGYRPEFYQTSRRIAQLALVPALASAPDATVVASGFSCREQIEGLAGRPTLHLAELLARA